MPDRITVRLEHAVPRQLQRLVGRPQRLVFASVPEEGDQEQQYADRCDVPHDGAHQRDSRCIEGKVGDTPPEIELSTPLGERVVPAGSISCENDYSEERKRFEEVP